MAKDYHRKPGFQLRLEPRVLEALRRKADKHGLPLNQYISDILEREADDTTAYHLQMASKHSFMCYAMMNVLAGRLLPSDIRPDVIKTIGEQGTRLFGVNPEVPEAIASRRGHEDDTFVSELFSLFERHGQVRWNIRPE